MRRRVRFAVRGTVQGVGFRPFVWRLASELGLAGWVENDAAGVTLEVEGDATLLERFAGRLVGERPTLARIEALDRSWLESVGEAGFRIRDSRAGGEPTVPVLPDVATCPTCLAEVLATPGDRRYRYPFANCTHCGPRFSIVRELPYDRARTTMAGFAMCAGCRREYDSPGDRRFHAQPNACPACGPRLAWWDGSGNVRSTADEALRDAVAALAAGRIVAFKGLGGFLLAVDARDDAAVRRLRERKPRRDKPLALMVATVEQARELCRLDASEAAALRSPEAPILLLRRRPAARIADAVAPGQPTLGLMLAGTPLHHLLLAGTGFPLVATSGNRSEEPLAIDEHEALERLGGIADGFLVHDRPIARHVDDSIAWVVAGETRVLRRARGFAPRPVPLCEEAPVLLAVGAELKNAVALSIGRRVVVSQHIGDMQAPEAAQVFERVVEDLLRLHRARPVAVVHDLHPDYATTRWAHEAVSGEGPLAGLPAIPVAHHHAHLASCLADSGAAGDALGAIWDGTGYGEDGTVWGGEFLHGSAGGSERVACLRPFLLPGGEAAVREPRRSALALLHGTFGGGALEMNDLAPLRAFERRELGPLGTMLERGVRSPRTTSAGRLFDGVASLVGLLQRATFEGQAALALEHAADGATADAYPIPLEPGTPLLLDWRPLVEAIVADLRRGAAPGTIAARFHNALVEALVAVAVRVGCGRVALSGGCFQNRRLVESSTARLRLEGFEVLLHRQVPPNDGGISLGQVATAAALLGGRR